ncbi:grasp-with-spasm system SPASM domain peptide maturase [Taibaiella koreensis]|uniref:grasp-with-spasm system SPASM domain peptide maturase n=1 Tax=Taibaiella koreensis TaxID=1268548 RepID=UPI000E59F71E|nr:grasp-with-spasm system SPASM domain peptide maturase [Taibaiella koreensis]
MTYFKLFTNCIVSKGIARSLICDLQRQSSTLIPNDLVAIITELDSATSVEDLFRQYGAENRETISEYLAYLTENEYGFYCESLEEFNRFPPMSTAFSGSGKITNAVIEVSEDMERNLGTILEQLNGLRCTSLVLMFYRPMDIDGLQSVLERFDGTEISSVEIVTAYHEAVGADFLKNLNARLTPLTSILFYNAPFDRTDPWDRNIYFDVRFSRSNIHSFKHCGIVSAAYFDTNFPKVLEAMNHNSCLHKKIGIDIHGNIKNCPAMETSFGNIRETKLAEALEHPGFKQYWGLTKDDIAVCRDCEYRYICTDCRAYTGRTHIDTGGLDTSKPLKCGYDPYTNEWAEWSVHPLRQEAIRYYGLEELVRNNE